MNLWLVAAIFMILLLIPCIWLCVTASIMERFAALQMAQILAVLVMLLLGEGFHREIYSDMSLVLAVLSLASGLVYVRFLERWL